SVNSGASSYSSGRITWASTFARSLPIAGCGSSAWAEKRRIFRLFALIAFPHRNDVPRALARRPDDHHHSPRQKPDGLAAGLPVVTPPILDAEGSATENLGRIGEIEAAIFEGHGPLDWVESDLHANNCTPNNGCKSSRFRGDTN